VANRQVSVTIVLTYYIFIRSQQSSCDVQIVHEISESVVGLSLFLFGAELHSSSTEIVRVKNNDR
jgi:hypothetical protein